MINIFRKLIGHKFGNRYKWGEFIWHPYPKNWKLSVKLTDRYGEYTDLLIICPLLCSMYIYLPTKLCALRSGGDMGDGKSYGFYVYPDINQFETFVIQWGKYSKHIEMPWTYKWHSTEILDYDYKTVWYEDKHMKIIPWNYRYKSEEFWKNETSKVYDYAYTRKNGEIQHRKATVCVERRVWKMRWWPMKKLVRKSIWVTFDKEIGEGIDSWKGGTTGCGWDIKDGETPEMTLRRMEREREFNR